MNPVPASVRAPRLPQVNLIPPEVGQRRARSRQRAVALLLLLLFVLLMAGLGYWILTLKADAEQRLADAEERSADLQSEAATYSEVPVVRDLLQNVTDARMYAGASELNYDEFLSRVTGALPANIQFDTITISKVGLTSNPGAAAGPFARPDVGSLSFSATSEEFVSSAALADSLESLVGLELVRVTTTARALEDGAGEDDDGGEVVYVIDGTARITIEALSDRFAPEDRGEPIDLDADPEADEPAEDTEQDDADDEGDV